MDSSLVILITLVMSAFFSGMEIAFITVNKLRIELRSKQDIWSARLLSKYIKAPSKFIGTVLVGNNIALVIYGIYMGAIVAGFLENRIPPQYLTETLSLTLQTIVSTVVVIIFAEFIPKALFRINPDFILNLLLLPFQFFYYLFWPAIHFVVWLAKTILQLFIKQSFGESTTVFTKVDLDHYISESANMDHNENTDVDTEIVKNVLDFAKLRVRETMVPRTELVAIEQSDTIDHLYEKFLESGHSRIVVFKDTIDNIIGYVHLVDMFKRPESIQSILIPIIIATESMMVSELLTQFTKSHRSIALVVDEFGGTAGIVTLEDIMEEIFGEIEDEHDVEEMTEIIISENEYEFSARLEVDYLNEYFQLNIPEGDYETLGGFILSRHESIPDENEIISFDGFEFIILKVTNARIDRVRMKILPE